jgi:hypothetical protein
MTQHAIDTIAATKGPIGALGGKFMFHPTTVKMGKQAGFPNTFAWYVAGRGGVLGDGDADVQLAAWGYFEPALLRKMWEVGTRAVPARTAGTLYAKAAQQWGRDYLAGNKSLAAFNKLAGKLVSNADRQGLPLFAGWSAEPLPQDDEGRAGQLLHVLREYRGSVHLLGVVASGLTPLQAHVTLRGAAGARTFGWHDEASLPKPKPALWRKAEALTDKLCIPTYASLTEREAASFTKAVTSIAKSVKD